MRPGRLWHFLFLPLVPTTVIKILPLFQLSPLTDNIHIPTFYFMCSVFFLSTSQTLYQTLHHCNNNCVCEYTFIEMHSSIDKDILFSCNQKKITPYIILQYHLIPSLFLMFQDYLKSVFYNSGIGIEMSFTCFVCLICILNLFYSIIISHFYFFTSFNNWCYLIVCWV